MPLPERELIEARDLRPYTEYAVQPFRGDYSTIPLRPCRAVVIITSLTGISAYSFHEKWLKVWVPDDDIPTLHQASRVHVLGEWLQLAPQAECPGQNPMTWHQLAAHYYGEVLRHNSLVERLDKIGIHRAAEPYLITPDTPSAFYRNLTLNYDELDQLLTKAGL